MTTALVVPRGLETDVFYHLSVLLTNEKQCYIKDQESQNASDSARI